ncbi:uncharacterized protein LOC119739876 isoform X2 [Patiria miniata]|nr:uncharacterized protein LOC119739876 isoform X2 [Patiria miniata]
MDILQMCKGRSQDASLAFIFILTLAVLQTQTQAHQTTTESPSGNELSTGDEPQNAPPVIVSPQPEPKCCMDADCQRYCNIKCTQHGCLPDTQKEVLHQSNDIKDQCCSTGDNFESTSSSGGLGIVNGTTDVTDTPTSVSGQQTDLKTFTSASPSNGATITENKATDVTGISPSVQKPDIDKRPSDGPSSTPEITSPEIITPQNGQTSPLPRFEQVLLCICVGFLFLIFCLILAFILVYYIKRSRRETERQPLQRPLQEYPKKNLTEDCRPRDPERGDGGVDRNSKNRTSQDPDPATSVVTCQRCGVTVPGVRAVPENEALGGHSETPEESEVEPGACATPNGAAAYDQPQNQDSSQKATTEMNISVVGHKNTIFISTADDHQCHVNDSFNSSDCDTVSE